MLQGKTPRFFYGYVIVAAAAAIMFVFHGIMFSFGVFFTPILEDLELDRASLSVVMALHAGMHGAVSLFSGRLTDRIGPRISLVISGVTFGLGTMLMSQVSTVWQLYLFGGVLRGIGMGFCVVPLTSILVRWFVKRRTLMTGLALTGMGTGTLVMPLVINSLIMTSGWRETSIIMGILALVVIVSAAQFLKRDPARMGLLPYGADQAVNNAVNNNIDNNIEQAEEGITLREAIRTRQFRMLVAAYFSTAFAAGAIMLHLVPHAIELSISPANAAVIMSVTGGSGLVARLVWGHLADRHGTRRILLTNIVLLSSCILLLLVARDLWTFYIFAALFGFGQGGVSVLMSPIIADLFGLKWHGSIQGFLVFLMTFATAGSPVLAGELFDISGSYQLTWQVFSAITIAGLVLVFVLQHIHRRGGQGATRRSP